MVKLKPLLPTLRERKRYLAFEVLSKKPLEWHAIKNEVAKAIHNHIGRDGTAEAGIIFTKHNKQKGVIRVNNKWLNKIKASLLFITEINKQRVMVRSLGASGMLHKATAHIGMR